MSSKLRRGANSALALVLIPLALTAILPVAAHAAAVKQVGPKARKPTRTPRRKPSSAPATSPPPRPRPAAPAPAAPASVALAGSTWEATVHYEGCENADDKARCRRPHTFLYTFHSGGTFTDTEVNIYECAPNCEDKGYWQQNGAAVKATMRDVTDDGGTKNTVTLNAVIRGGRMEGSGVTEFEGGRNRWTFAAVRSRPREMSIVLNLTGTKWVGKQDDCTNGASIRQERPVFVNAGWSHQDGSAFFSDSCKFELNFFSGGRFVYRDIGANKSESGTWRQTGDSLTASFTDKDGDTFTFEGTNNGIRLAGRLTIKYKNVRTKPTTSNWTAIR